MLGTALIAGCSGGGSAGDRQAEVQRDQTAIKRRQAREARPAAPPMRRRINCAKVRCLALTFDDGPGDHTRVLLNELGRSGTRATFFVLGQNVGVHPDLVRRMVYEGHEVGNHTWSHPIMTSLSSGEARSQVTRTQKAIQQASGYTPKLFRPPYGTTDKRVAQAVRMPQIAWSVDTLDWNQAKAKKAMAAGVKNAQPGGIILMHDIQPRTVQKVPWIVATLRQRGFTLVTVPELFQSQRLQARAMLYTGLG